MNLQLMGKIDRVFGVPFCFLLTLHKKTKNKYKSEVVTAVNKILVMKFLGMGSIILARPFFAELRKKHPEAKIFFLTFNSNKETADLLADCDEILTINSNKILHFVYDLFKSIIALRKEKLDIVYDLEFFSRFSAIVAYLVGAKQRVGYYLREVYRGDFLTSKIYYSPYRHISKMFLSLLHFQEEDDKLDLKCCPYFILPDMSEQLTSILIAHNMDKDTRFLCVNVNSSDLCSERKWSISSFAELIRKINSKYPFRIIMIGIKRERNYVDQVIKQSGVKNIINLAGELSFRQLAALLKKSELFISNDSGPLHLAVAIGVKTISFFGPETPLLYGPQGDGHVVFYKNISCSPCLTVHNYKVALCDMQNVCMQAINVNEVFAAVVQSLGG